MKKKLFVTAAKAATVSLTWCTHLDTQTHPSSAIVFTSLRPLTNIKQKQEFRWAGGGKFTSPPRRVPEWQSGIRSTDTCRSCNADTKKCILICPHVFVQSNKRVIQFLPNFSACGLLAVYLGRVSQCVRLCGMHIWWTRVNCLFSQDTPLLCVRAVYVCGRRRLSCSLILLRPDDIYANGCRKLHHWQ